MTATETATVVDEIPVETVIPSYFDTKRRPSLFSHEPKVEALGATGCQGTFVNSQGLRIASYYWPVIFTSIITCLMIENTPFCCEQCCARQSAQNPKSPCNIYLLIRFI